jgi:hypothetical protein
MVTYLKGVDPNIAIFIATSLIAFISWILKSLIEKPLLESKNTFNKFFEKRVEILSEIKVKLGFISYFPDYEESKEFKEQIQNLLIKDGKAAYLNKLTLDSVIRISIDPTTDTELVNKTIAEIDEDLYEQISKVKDEIDFYKKYSNYNPFKRFIGFTILSFQYILSLTLVISMLLLFSYLLLTSSWPFKIFTTLFIVFSLYLINKWMKR